MGLIAGFVLLMLPLSHASAGEAVKLTKENYRIREIILKEVDKACGRSRATQIKWAESTLSEADKRFGIFSFDCRTGKSRKSQYGVISWRAGHEEEVDVGLIRGSEVPLKAEVE